MGELLFYRTHRRASIPFEENSLKLSKWHLLMNGSFLSTHFSSLRPGMRLRRFCILLATFIQTPLSRLGSELFRDFLQNFAARVCISALHCVRPYSIRLYDFKVPRFRTFFLKESGLSRRDYSGVPLACQAVLLSYFRRCLKNSRSSVSQSPSSTPPRICGR